MCEYQVKTNGGNVIATGRLLSELIEHTVLLKIKEIEKETNVLIRLDRQIYKYLNQLSCFYNLSEIHAELIEQNWDYIENFLEIYNQDAFIEQTEFINICEVENHDTVHYN